MIGLIILSLVLYFFKDNIKTMVGKIISPLKSKFRLSSAFGDRVHPVTKQISFHNGVDFATPTGTPLYAAFDGVITTFQDAQNGNGIALLNVDLKRRMGAAHLSKYAVENGAKVKQGDIIAYTGNTGRSTGPHVHITLKDTATNKWINPVTEIQF